MLLDRLLLHVFGIQMLDPVVPFTIAEALRPIRGAFLVVRKRHVGRRIRIDFFFLSKSTNGRCGTGCKEERKELSLLSFEKGRGWWRLWTALNAPIENVCKVEGNGGRGSGTIPLAVLFVGKQVFQRNVGAATVGDFNNSLSSASQTRPTTMQTPNTRGEEESSFAYNSIIYRKM